MYIKLWSEVVEQLKQSAKTVEDHDSDAKALKKAKAEVTRLTNKYDEAQNTMEKLFLKRNIMDFS